MADVRRHDDRSSDMDSVIARRRDPLAIPLDNAGITMEVLPERTHPGSRFLVRSQLAIGIDQRISLSWAFIGGSGGYRVLGFRRTLGFAPEEVRWDLTQHGMKIIDSTEAASKVEHLGEGEYFYTFVLRKRVLGLAEVTRDLVQFSEVIPSAKHVIQRLQDTIQARKLLGELAAMVKRERGGEERQTRVAGKAKQIMDWIIEHKRGVDDVRAMPEWATLSANEQELVMAALRDALRRGISGEP